MSNENVETLESISKMPPEKVKEELNKYDSAKTAEVLRKGLQRVKIDEQPLRETVTTLLLSNKRREATEELSSRFKEVNPTLSIRDDDKPEIYVYDNSKGFYLPNGNTRIESFVRGVVGEGVTKQLINEVTLKIRIDTYREKEEVFKDTPPNFIPVKNGLLGLITKTLNKHSPKWHFFTGLAVEYDKNADCPHFKQFIQETINNEDIPLLQEIFGYCLYRKNVLEAFFIFEGSGANGKSKVLEILKSLLGYENITSISLQELTEKDFHLSQLHNKLANISTESNAKSLYNTDKLKQISSNDSITADRKFKIPISFINFAKLVFSLNELPYIYDKSYAFNRRFIKISFPFEFLTKKEYESREDKTNCKLANPEILENIKTEEELSGILNWAIEGLIRLLANKQFSNTKTAAETKRFIELKSDSIIPFIEDCVQEDWEEQNHIPKEEFSKEYAKFCLRNKTKAVSERRIKKVMEEKGFFSRRIDLENKQKLSIWQNCKWKEVPTGSTKKTTKNTLRDKSDFLLKVKIPVESVEPVENNQAINDNKKDEQNIGKTMKIENKKMSQNNLFEEETEYTICENCKLMKDCSKLNDKYYCESCKVHIPIFEDLEGLD